MILLKKAGIIAGAIAGGVVGGGISLIGKAANIKAVDDIGASVTSSAILTGKIAGELLSGAADAVCGGLAHDRARIKSGIKDLKGCGKNVIGNFTENVKYAVGSSGEIAAGVKAKDKKRAIKSAKKFAKWLIVGAITVGAIKMAGSDDED